MNPALQLGFIAGIIQVTAFVLYNKQVLLGTAKPNTATWSMWLFLTVLNASSYYAMTKEPAQAILPIASATMAMWIYYYALRNEKFGRLQPLDWPVLALGVTAGVVWWWFKSATYANLLVVLAAAISFTPLYRDVWKNPTVEMPGPWYLWSIAYLCNLTVAFMQPKPELLTTLLGMVYPASMLLLHVGVGRLAERKINTKAEPKASL
jgi:hypothetical protein